MVKVEIGQLDNTAPTITNAEINGTAIKITANDEHQTLGEGSGVVGYRYITSLVDTDIEITEGEGTYTGTNQIDISNMRKVKYVYIAPVDKVGNIGETKKVKLPTYSYTVNYYEEGGTTKVAESKIGEDKALGEEITEEAIDIDGYNKIDPTRKTITIENGKNEINFYYVKKKDLTYTVKYLEQGTNEEIHETKIVTNQEYGTNIVEVC